MRRDAQDLMLSTQAARGMPTAAWVGIAVLGLAVAGMAGALVMRTLDSSPTPATAVSALTSQAAPATVEPAAPAVPPAAAPAPTTATAPAKAGASAHPKAKPAVAAAPAGPDRVEPVATSDAVARADAGAPAVAAPAPVCTTCGVVESISAVSQKGQGTGVGAVAGGVLGGVVGHQMGGGKGKTAMTVLGAVGGAFAGNEVEKRTHSETAYNVQVRMEDGSTRVVQQSQSMAVGTHVVVEGSTLRVASTAAKGG